MVQVIPYHPAPFSIPGSLSIRRLLCLTALLATLLPLPSGAQASPPLPRGRELHGTITVTVTGKAKWREEGDDESNTFSVSRTATHRVKINSAEAFPGNAQGVAVYRGSEVAFSASVDDIARYGDSEPTIWKGAISGSCPGGRDVTLLGLICEEGMVTMVVVPRDRTYGLSFNTLVVETENGEIPVSGVEIDSIPLPSDPNARLTGTRTIDVWEYERQGINRGNASLTDNLPEQVKAKAVVTWNLGPPELLEVVLESESYDNWTPEGDFNNPSKAGGTITFTATVSDRTNPGNPSDKKARITFQLENVSMERGVCLNSPADGGSTDYDLQILKAGNPKLDVVGPDEARTPNEVSQSSVTVSSFDYGGYADLRVTAETSSGKLPVRFKGREISLLPIPRTRPGQRTAESWLGKYDLGGSPDNSDRESVPGQSDAGDGLSIYENYRGMVILEEGKRVFRRLDPKRKIHFVIDEKNAIDPAKWEEITGSVLYKLDKSLVSARRANPNSGYGSAGNKYAVIMEVVNGMSDPFTGQTRPDQLGYTTGEFAVGPSHVEHCVIFPDRVRGEIDRVAASIKSGLDDPESNAGKLILRAGFSIVEAQELFPRVTPAWRAELTRRMSAMVALHELAHTCNIVGHGPIPPFGEEWKETAALFDEGCIMQYLSARTWHRFVLAGELAGEGKICPVCFTAFNPKN